MQRGAVRICDHIGASVSVRERGRPRPNRSLERTGLLGRIAGKVGLAAEVSPGVEEPGPPRRSPRGR